jgi:hypothetical protein
MIYILCKTCVGQGFILGGISGGAGLIPEFIGALETCKGNAYVLSLCLDPPARLQNAHLISGPDIGEPDTLKTSVLLSPLLYSLVKTENSFDF